MGGDPLVPMTPDASVAEMPLNGSSTSCMPLVSGEVPPFAGARATRYDFMRSKKDMPLVEKLVAMPGLGVQPTPSPE